MSKTQIILFWVIWLLDVLLLLYGHREFIMGVFGRYAAPGRKYIMLWTLLLSGGLVVVIGSWALKQAGQHYPALLLAGAPLVLASPYLLWIGAILVFGRKTNWR